MTVAFGFGENWLRFAADLRDDQIAEATRSLQALLGKSDLAGLSFLDIGSGSGLSSLCARKLGARVHSFDFDLSSVACTKALRQGRFPDDTQWTVDQGSILDTDYVSCLGTFDIVYSWGVLHHTGAMWDAIDRAASLVAPGGILAIALYRRTPLCGAWRMEKRLYASAPRVVQTIVSSIYKVAYLAGIAATGRNPLSYVRNYKSMRGMNWHRDVHDWMGGYPYESVAPEEVKARFKRLGFTFVRSVERPAGLGIFGTGCDEFVFRK